MKHTPWHSYIYARKAGKRLPELEDIILTHSWYSYLYARDVIKGRWIEAEDIMMTDPHESYCYAAAVIEGKLPEKMHNMMILHAIEAPNNSFVKEYFELIK